MYQDKERAMKWWKSNFQDDIKKVFQSFRDNIIHADNFSQVDKTLLERELKTFFERNARECAEKESTKEQFYERLAKFLDFEPNFFILIPKIDELKKKYSEDVKLEMEHMKKIYELEKDETIKNKHRANIQSLEKIYKLLVHPQTTTTKLTPELIVELEKRLVQIHNHVRKPSNLPQHTPPQLPSKPPQPVVLPLEKKITLKESCKIFIDRVSAMEREKTEEFHLKLKKLKGEGQEIELKKNVSKKRTREYSVVPVSFKKDHLNYNEESILNEIKGLKLKFINQEYYEYQCKLISKKLCIYLNEIPSKKFKIIEQNLETKDSQILSFNNNMTLSDCIELYENHSILINELKIHFENMKKTDKFEVLFQINSNLKNNEIQVEMDIKSFIQFPKLIIKLANDKIVDVKFDELPVDNFNFWFLKAKKNFYSKEFTQIFNILSFWYICVEETLNF